MSEMNGDKPPTSDVAGLARQSVLRQLDDLREVVLAFGLPGITPK